MIENVISCKCRFCGEEAGFKSKKYSALKYSCRNKKCRKYATYLFNVCSKKRHILYEEFRTKKYEIRAYYVNSSIFESYRNVSGNTVLIIDKKNGQRGKVDLSLTTIESIKDLSKINKIIETAALLQ